MLNNHRSKKKTLVKLRYQKHKKHKKRQKKDKILMTNSLGLIKNAMRRVNKSSQTKNPSLS